MRDRNKRKLIMYGLMVALMVTTVAYAVLQTTLNIRGTVTKKGGSWDIHFANLSSPGLTGDATSTNEKLEATSFTFRATVEKPLDSIVYTFDVINSGTIDATLDSITLSGATEAKAQDITYTLTYKDGSAISKGDSLRAGQIRNLKLTVSYDDVTNISETDITLSLGATLIYVQASEKQEGQLQGDVTSKILADGDEVYLNPQTGELCSDYIDSNSNSGVTSGCMKWYAFNDNGSTVSLLLDHNIVENVNVADDEGNGISPNQLMTNYTTSWNSNLKARSITVEEIFDLTGIPKVDITKIGEDDFTWDDYPATADVLGWASVDNRGRDLYFSFWNYQSDWLGTGYFTSDGDPDLGFPDVNACGLYWSAYGYMAYDIDQYDSAHLTSQCSSGLRPVITYTR